jgi:predicted metal-dependent HD superfamily phosphohydrolase
MEVYGVRPEAGAPVFDLLVTAYSSSDRHYHNLEHLDEMFRVAARLGTLTDDAGPLQLAIWFHDAVYDSRADDNEARSAELAVTLLGPIGLPASVLERVTRLIRATAHTSGVQQPPGDRDTLILLDADMSVFGTPEDRYRRYAADIRREYAWVAEVEYRKGRSRVLEQFLARPRIYWHDLTFQELDGPARANIRAELAELTGGPSP